MNTVKLGSILEMTKGKKPLFQTKEYEEGLLPYVDIKAFETGIVDNYTDGQKCLFCEDGDILLVCDGSRSGLVGYAIEGYVGSTLAKLSADGLINSYLYYFLQSKYQILNTNQKGTGTPHVNPEVLKNFEIPIPSISEQERIVARVEELFSQLDKSVETLQKIKEQLTVYRQAVLKDAFEGKLTNCIKIDDANLGSLIEKPRYGTSKKCSYSITKATIPVYRIPNINHHFGVIDHSDLKYAEFKDSELNALTLQEGDLLLIRSNGSASLVGRAAMVKQTDLGGTFAGYLIRLRIKDQMIMNPKYLLLYLQSFAARCYIENKAKSTSGVHNINSDEISELKIPLYRLNEQQTIIEAIEARTSICDKISEIIEQSLNQAEAMRQSILKQAFEGKL